MPTEETFPKPLKYIDATRATHTDLNVLQENLLTILSECGRESKFIGFLETTYEVHFIQRNFPWDTCASGGDSQKIKQLPDLTIFGLKFFQNGESRSEEREARKGKRETKAR